MRKRIHHCVVMCLLAVLLPVFAFSQGLPFKNFSIQNGLSQSVVTDIFQDSGGYVWISTEYGLNRFNRHEIVNYFATDGLSHNNVLTVFEDSFGTILVGTELGLDYQTDEGSFSPFPGTGILSGLAVSEIFEDSQGALWIGTNGAGLYRFKDDAYVTFDTRSGLVNNNIRNILEVPSGELYISTRGGVSVMFNNEVIQNYTAANGLAESRTRDVYYHAPDESIWIATRNGINILKDGLITHTSINTGLVHPRVTSFASDGKDGVWVATESGISHYRDGRFYNYNDNNGLNNNIVNVVYKDFENNMFFGTYGGGLDMLTGEKFIHYTTQHGLASNMITSFVQDDIGDIWVGSYGGGISRIVNGYVETYTTIDGLNDNRVYSLTLDKNGRMWIGTRTGVGFMDFGRFYIDSRYENLPDPKVRDIIEDRNGDIWIATYGGGVAQYRNNNLLKIWDTESGLADNTVMKLLESKDGSIWIATYGGVNIIQNGELRLISADDGLVQNSVISLFEDKHGRIWIGTFGGISIYENNILSNITTLDGLPNNVVYFVEEDDSGIMWLGTNVGLVRYNPEIGDDLFDPAKQRDALRFKLYTSESGLTANEMNSGAIIKDKDDNFWFGTVGGVNYLQWRLESEVQQGPPVHVEKIQLFDGSTIPQTDLVFQHDQNFIGFDFVGISFANPSQVIYEYRIRGIDQTWQRTSQRSVRYTTLPPGEHVFEVRARNNDGFWSASRGSFSFVILPPFWRTWWFLFVLILLLALVVGFIYNYYRIAQMVDLERIRIRIASDLHDDVGASLTEIALQADFLQATQKDPNVGESLKQMGEMSRQIVTTMDDIVWSIDARNDKFGDLLDRMQDYASNVLVTRNIEAQFHFVGLNSDKELSLEIRQNLYLVYKEAVNNAAKHSKASEIHIRFEQKDGKYLLQIKDNGTGIPESTRSGSHGLKNMRLRAERIKASIEFVNDNGLTITITGKGL